jgi:hypothetical protein
MCRRDGSPMMPAKAQPAGPRQNRPNMDTDGGGRFSAVCTT